MKKNELSEAGLKVKVDEFIQEGSMGFRGEAPYIVGGK